MGDDDVRPVMGADEPRVLAHEMADDPAGDVFDVHDPFAQVGIVDCAQRANVFLRDLVEDILDVALLAFEAFEHLVDERAVLDDEQVGVENARVLRADRGGDALLDFEQFPAG